MSCLQAMTKINDEHQDEGQHHVAGENVGEKSHSQHEGLDEVAEEFKNGDQVGYDVPHAERQIEMRHVGMHIVFEPHMSDGAAMNEEKCTRRQHEGNCKAGGGGTQKWDQP